MKSHVTNPVDTILIIKTTGTLSPGESHSDILSIKRIVIIINNDSF